MRSWGALDRLSLVALPPPPQAQTAFPELARAADAVRRTFAILDRKPEISPAGGVQMEMEGAVELRRVAFAYPSRPGRLILKEFSLSVAAGSSCALVGAGWQLQRHGKGTAQLQAHGWLLAGGRPLDSCRLRLPACPVPAGGRERPRQIDHHSPAGAVLRPRGGAGVWLGWGGRVGQAA